MNTQEQIQLLKEVNNAVNKQGAINYLNENDIDYYNMNDLEMYALYLEHKYKDIAPVIEFEQCDDDSNKYTFTYESTKNGVQIECNGYLEPYYTGRAIEHNVIIDDSENMEDDDQMNTAQEVEEEIMNAFYNQVRI